MRAALSTTCRVWAWEEAARGAEAESTLTLRCHGARRDAVSCSLSICAGEAPSAAGLDRTASPAAGVDGALAPPQRWKGARRRARQFSAAKGCWASFRWLAPTLSLPAPEPPPA